jgi:hypothetical protein
VKQAGDERALRLQEGGGITRQKATRQAPGLAGRRASRARCAAVHRCSAWGAATGGWGGPLLRTRVPCRHTHVQSCHGTWHVARAQRAPHLGLLSHALEDLPHVACVSPAVISLMSSRFLLKLEMLYEALIEEQKAKNGAGLRASAIPPSACASSPACHQRRAIHSTREAWRDRGRVPRRASERHHDTRVRVRVVVPAIHTRGAAVGQQGFEEDAPQQRLAGAQVAPVHHL